MTGKRICLSVLMAAVCGLNGLHAQGPAPAATAAAAPAAAPDALPLYTPFGSDGSSPYDPTTRGGSFASVPSFVSAPAGVTAEGVALDEGNPAPPPPVPIPLGLPRSPYLTYPRSPCCCGAVGTCGGPIGSEIFFRSGFAFPIGTGIFERYLHTGWDVEGGGRLFLFNRESTAAWTGTLSVSNIFARTGNANLPITLYRVPVHTLVQSSTAPVQGALNASTPAIVQVPELTVSVSSLNMTFVNMGFGREWWLCGTAYPGAQKGWNWRAGCDFGGRWGSAEVQFNEIQHHTDVVGGMYAAIHTDVEHPFRCGIAFAGIRFEYNYIWTSLLQDQNDGDFQSLNLLFQLGVRF